MSHDSRTASTAARPGPRSLLALPVALGVLRGVLDAGGQFLPVLLGRPGAGLGPLPFVVGFAGFVVSPVLVAVAGYRLAGRFDVAAAWRTYAARFAGGGTIGYLLGAVGATVVVGVAVVPGELDPFVLQLSLSTAYNAVLEAVRFAVAGVAGAAVRRFERNA